MTEFGKRVRQARKHAKLSQDKLAGLVGIAQGTLSELEKHYASSSYTVQIAEACGVSPRWLATGEGDMLSQDEKVTAIPKIGYSQPPDQNVTSVTSLVRIPVLSWGEAERYRAGMFVEPERRREFVRGENLGLNAFIMVVEGDSMYAPGAERSFPQGTLLVVDKGAPTKSGDFVIAKDPSTGAETFKRLLADAGRWYLRPLNPAYPSVELVSKDEAIIGRVVRGMISLDC